jgi:hypothetical protein
LWSGNPQHFREERCRRWWVADVDPRGAVFMVRQLRGD